METDRPQISSLGFSLTTRDLNGTTPRGSPSLLSANLAFWTFIITGHLCFLHFHLLVPPTSPLTRLPALTTSSACSD